MSNPSARSRRPVLVIAVGLALAALALSAANGAGPAALAAAPQARLAQGASFAEGFDKTGATQAGTDGPSGLIAAGWIFRNQSAPRGTSSWYGSGATQAFGPHSGTGFLANDWNSTVCGTGAAISNWAVLPAIPGQAAGDLLSFYVQGSVYVTRTDRVQVRYSPSGGTGTGSGPADTGDFTTLLLDINPVPRGAGWIKQSVSLPGNGRIALRYFLPEAGPCSVYGGFFGVDTLVVGTPPAGPIPIPQPGQTVTWEASISPVVIDGRQIIPAGGTVVVDPGVEIRVSADSTLVMEGTLRGAGTATSPIRVTAPAVFPPALEVPGTLDLANAVVGGQVQPADGGSLLFSQVTFQDFGTIFDPGLTNRPAYLRVDQSQFNGVDLYVSDVSLRVSNTRFTNANLILNRGYQHLSNVQVSGGYVWLALDYQPVYLNDLSVTGSTQAGLRLGGSQAGNNFLIGPNVTLQNNLYPVGLESGGLLAGSVLPPSGNTNNQILLSAQFDQRGPVSWANLGLPYRLEGLPSLIGRWDLLPGVTLLLGRDSGLLADDGTLVARGLPGAPVTIQRLDPAAAWLYLMVPARLEHVVVDGSQLGLIYPQLGLPRYIDNATLSNNGRALVGAVIVRKTQFLSNVTGAVVSFPTDLNGQTNPNSFVGNTLAVESAQDARYNWWGSPSGPRLPDGSGGTGDPINSGVPYQPFRTSPPDFADTPPVVRLRQTSFLAEAGQKVMLAWEAQDNAGVVRQRVLFSPAGDSPANYTVIADNLPASQTALEWTVPNIGFQVTGGLASIRVVAVDTAGQEGWDAADLLIPSNDLPGTLSLTSDLRGPFTAGDTVPICWTASGLDLNANSVDAYLFLDGDGRSVPLGGVHTGLSCLAGPLQMPFVGTDRARVGLRLTSSLNRVKWFFSDYFTIRPDSRLGEAPPTISLLSPAAGQTFAAGSAIPIAWTALDDEGVRGFEVQASYDGGRTWHVVAADLPASATSYSWQTAPGSGFANLRVRVVVRDRRFQNASATVAISTGGGAPAPSATPTTAPKSSSVPTVAPTPTPISTLAPTRTPVPTLAPSATPVPTADSVAIQRADYTVSKRVLRVEATSTNGSATLRVYVASTDELIGTLANRGTGRYGGQFSWPTNPQSITVRSSLGGSATSTVTAK